MFTVNRLTRLTVYIKLNFNGVLKMARENFDNELSKVKRVNKSKSFRLLDDLGTAFLSAYSENEHLDKSLLYVKLTRKALLSKGYTLAEIDDYLIERSIVSKTRVNKLRTESIYMNDSTSIAPHIENRVDRHNARTTTDLIIDGLLSRPELLNALKNGIKKSWLNEKFEIKNPTMLIDFYNQHKDIIHK
jgi:hypothetical protein